MTSLSTQIWLLPLLGLWEGCGAMACVKSVGEIFLGCSAVGIFFGNTNSSAEFLSKTFLFYPPVECYLRKRILVPVENLNWWTVIIFFLLSRRICRVTRRAFALVESRKGVSPLRSHRTVRESLHTACPAFLRGLFLFNHKCISTQRIYQLSGCDFVS